MPRCDGEVWVRSGEVWVRSGIMDRAYTFKVENVTKCAWCLC